MESDARDEMDWLEGRVRSGHPVSFLCVYSEARGDDWNGDLREPVRPIGRRDPVQTPPVQRSVVQGCIVLRQTGEVGSSDCLISEGDDVLTGPPMSRSVFRRPFIRRDRVSQGRVWNSC
jgi:hypothetical protein